MSRKPSGYQEIRVTAASIAGPYKVNMGVRGRRALSFASLSAARSFVDGFDVDKLTVQIGPRLPAFMR